MPPSSHRTHCIRLVSDTKVLEQTWQERGELNNCVGVCSRHPRYYYYELLKYSHHILIVHLSCFSNDTHKLLFCNQHYLCPSLASFYSLALTRSPFAIPNACLFYFYVLRMMAKDGGEYYTAAPP
jgi:hypothetical protein